MGEQLRGNFFVRDKVTNIGLATGITLPVLNGKFYHTFMFDPTSAEVLERYETKEAAVEGHAKWLKWLDLKNQVLGW